MDGGEFLHVGQGAYPGRALCVGGRGWARGASQSRPWSSLFQKYQLKLISWRPGRGVQLRGDV